MDNKGTEKNKIAEAALNDIREKLKNMEERHIDEEIGGGKLSILKNKDFTKLFTGQTISDIGSNFSYIALLFLIIDIGNKLNMSDSEITSSIALITLIQIMPVLIIGPFAGIVVDRYDRKKIMMIMDITGAIAALSLVYINDLLSIYAISVLFSLYRIFFYPAKGASLPMIVKQEQLVQANGLSSTTFQLSSIIGPAISGVFIAYFGIRAAFIVDGISYIVGFIFTMIIHTDLHPINKNNSFTLVNTVRDMGYGFRLILKDRILMYVLLSTFFFILVISIVNPLFAPYLTFTFNLNEKDYGFILTFASISGFIVAAIITYRGKIHRKLTMIAMAMAIGGFSVFIIGLAPSVLYPIPLLYLGMALIGTVNVLLTIPMSTLFQTIVPNENLGKINSILGWVISLGQIVSAFLATQLVIRFTISTIFYYAGLITIPISFLSLLYIYSRGMEKEVWDREAEMLEIAREQTMEINRKIFEIKEDEMIFDLSNLDKSPTS